MTGRIVDVAVHIDGKPIVKGVSLDIAEGTIVGLVGPNGSGKSTLLRSIYRRIRPVVGAVFVDSNDVWKSPPRQIARVVAAVCQESALTHELSVYDLVQLGRFPHGSAFGNERGLHEATILAALSTVGMEHKADCRVSQLSGGEKQRALIAKALAQEPQLLVLDEPTNHLDIRFQLEVLAAVRRTGLATLMTLHDLNLAAAYCDELHLIFDGRVVASGSPATVLTPERVQAVYGVKSVSTLNPLTGKHALFFQY